MKLNKEELFVGSFAPLGLVPLYGWWVLPLCPITGLLWALGGSGYLGTKSWRRVIIPLIINLLIVFKQGSGWGLLIFPAGWAILTIPYGTRDVNDEGSSFGNWCLSVTGSQLGATIMSRGIIITALIVTTILFGKL